MKTEIGTYSFLPWLRQGIANNITTPHLDEDVKLRASIRVALTLKGDGIGNQEVEPISRDVGLYGPGDIIGIESRAIVKSEPADWITNFEPNYMPYVDFYDEDFPWRYTPAAPDPVNGRLCPWVMLVVLEESEFEDLNLIDRKNSALKPLPYLKVSDAGTVFPPADQLWAWAHVHVNEDLVKLEGDVENSDMDAVLPRLSEVLKRNPDLAYSRIMCPRRLAPNTAYNAFLIPVFETGRLAGLDSDIPPDTMATKSSWSDGQTEFPYYHRWYFRTGTVGDFEYLVRLLEPKPVDARVGRRDMDVLDPAPNISGIDDEELGGILRLGGALKIPFDSMAKADQAEVRKYDKWAEPYPRPFQSDLASYINLSDDYSKNVAATANQGSGIDIIGDLDAGDPDDPMITPPLYGRWHAKTKRLRIESGTLSALPNGNWVHELNLDPRWRVAAGFGTKVVQDKQEEYMDAAWGQMGEILEANRRIRYGQFAKEASWILYSKHVIPLQQQSIEKAFTFTAPIHKRVMAQGVTVYHKVNTSRVPRAIASPPMRRIIRPGSRLMRLLPFDDAVRPHNLIERINREDVYSAPPKKIPDSLPTLDDLSDSLMPANVPNFLLKLLSRYPWLQYVPLLLAIVLLVFFLVFGFAGISSGVGTALLAAFTTLFALMRRLTRRVQEAESVLEKNQKPESVDKLPKSPDFRISEVEEDFVPSRGETDSAEAIRFKAALHDSYELNQLSAVAGKVPKPDVLDVKHMVVETIRGINPELTLPRLVWNSIRVPAHIIKLVGEGFTEAMAYPELDIPMYKPLAGISAELFLPNINFIEQNTISLLETNQRFIESYMVGLNHEFARELLWREYPTDQRGSYFRQFWDVSSYLNTENEDAEDQKEKLRDIPPLDRWRASSKLGDHDNREIGVDAEEEAVVVIRGELLKKYPTAVIYAHKAEWHKNDDGSIDNTSIRKLVGLTDEELEKPPLDKIRTPLYEAKVDPDIYFFGFDLTIEEAMGSTGENPGDENRPGWFIVIKERPGEPRFGLDIDREGDVNVWNDLTWKDVIPGDTPGSFINVTAVSDSAKLVEPVGEELAVKHDQYEEDDQLSWHEDMNAGELAYILYQVPVLVAVHGSEMLPKPKPGEN